MNRKSWQHSKLDKSVTDRFKKLGDIGEAIAVTLLQEAGFTDIENLNSSLGANVKYFDIRAKRGKKNYVVSVKARNKFENSGKLNSRYKLFDDPKSVMVEAKTKYNCEVAWVTVAVDIPNGTLDAYFGPLASLEGNKKGVPMSEKAIGSYERLAFCFSLEKFGIPKEVYEKLINSYKKRSSGGSI